MPDQGVTVPGITQATVNTLIAAAVPSPATSAPPGVTDASAQGNILRYAMENHTHASKARKARQAVSTSTYTWTFPTAFSAGVVPVCNAIAETAPGSTELINVQIDGPPTNTQCTFRITRYQQSVASLLGLTVLSLNSTPASITLAMLALEP